MADEIKLNLRMTFEKGGTSVTAKAENLSVDVSGSRFIHNRQSVGTSEEALDLGDISTGGFFFATNQDSTNFVELRSGTGATDFVKLKAGESCCFRISGDASAPYAIADTSAVDLEYWLIAD